MALFILKKVKFKDIIQYPDIEIPEKITTFICGESGSGKSTLLKLLNGVLSSTDGEISYRGKNINDYNPIILRRNILLIGQSVYLFDKSIKENFNEYYAYRDMQVISEKKMKEYLALCSVGLPLDSMCDVLSGGELQRIFIAISISFHPHVLMIDEPTSALDEKNANMLIENVTSYCKTNGTTLIVVSHDRVIADRYADNIIALS